MGSHYTKGASVGSHFTKGASVGSHFTKRSHCGSCKTTTHTVLYMNILSV